MIRVRDRYFVLKDAVRARDSRVCRPERSPIPRGRASGGRPGSYHDLIPVGSRLQVLANRKKRIEPDRNGQPLIEEARCRDAESRQGRSTIGGALQKTTATQDTFRGLAGLVRF